MCSSSTWLSFERLGGQTRDGRAIRFGESLLERRGDWGPKRGVSEFHQSGSRSVMKDSVDEMLVGRGCLRRKRLRGERHVPQAVFGAVAFAGHNEFAIEKDKRSVSNENSNATSITEEADGDE